MNSTILPLILMPFIVRPMLAKNTGERNIYESVSNLFEIYFTSFSLEIARPATNAPVISATPKSSATYAMSRQKTKEMIT